MGGWLRVKESVRECACMPGAHAATSNARIESMLKAAGAFSQQVKRCEAAITAAYNTNLELMDTTQAAMAARLPQPYPSSSALKAPSAVPHSPTLVGGEDCDTSRISRVGNATGHKLETEVLAPLARWQGVHQQLKVRAKQLKKTRLEMDARRHKLDQASAKVGSTRAKMAASNESPVLADQKVNATIHSKSHKEAKLQVATQMFEQEEAQLAQDLSALIEDGQYLKHYLAAALRLQGGALLGTADAFGELGNTPTPVTPRAAFPAGEISKVVENTSTTSGPMHMQSAPGTPPSVLAGPTLRAVEPEVAALTGGLGDGAAAASELATNTPYVAVQPTVTATPIGAR